jgi:hypothetical protein
MRRNPVTWASTVDHLRGQAPKLDAPPYTRVVAPTERQLAPDSEDRFWSGVAYAGRFFMAEAEVQHALLKLARLLDEARIPYAVLGAMALNEYGYRRVTIDIDVLLTAEGLEAFKALALGRGYAEKFPGSRGMRDTEHGVPIDVVVSGEYPGDGRPKPVRFPDPETVGVRGARVTLVPLPALIELKLASGMSAPHRLRDLADVLELIRVAHLPATLAEQLDPSVRQKYRELWDAAQAAEPE